MAVCGVSGSGKTSLAMDTLYAEGQRRYIESFSAYTRQFLERLDKPDYDRIDGLPPALAVARGAAPRGNRSTVGTASETLDYLRLLFAKASQLICHSCGQAVQSENSQTVARFIASLPKSLRLMIAFRVEWEDVSDRAAVLAELQADGFVRLIADGKQLTLGQSGREELADALPKSGEALVVVDRLRGGDDASRSTEGIESAFEQGWGEIQLLLESGTDKTEAHNSEAGGVEWESLPLATIDGKAWRTLLLSNQLRCTKCAIDYPDPEPRLFSFNSPLGACPKCEGFGDTIDLDMNLIFPDKNKTIREGAIAPWSTPAYSHNLDELLDLIDDLGIDADVPISRLRKRDLNRIVEGDEAIGYYGLNGFFKWLERKKYKMHVRVFLARWRSYNRCSECQGARLNPLALSFRFCDRNVAELCSTPISELRNVINKASLSERDCVIAQVPLQQLESRLGYLEAVGLGYLTLDRTLRTLSGGEAQRTALTAALGSSLVNMLYVLDEPSVGLHPHDVQRLVVAIGDLATRGNTVVMIEHEELLLDRADWLIEVGPRAGTSGGEIVFSGTRSDMLESGSLTGEYLANKRSVPSSDSKRSPSAKLELKGCTGNNLKGIDVEIPLGVLCLVTGVSGSGKSTLIQDTLFGALANRLTTSKLTPLPYSKILGTGQLDDCVLVDQSPVSRSPRSNPVTYVKAFDEIRNAFASTLDAKTRNYTPGHFSFNSDSGRCPQCSGDGMLSIDMQFLADIHVTCPSCNGSRYRSEILTIKYRDRSIADVLGMTVQEAIDFFRGATKVQNKLRVLVDVGLGYLQLGQSATTLSSGEAQRLKLASHLASASKKRTLFVLDEPTTGLHTNDIVQLLKCFDALLVAGHSLVVVEHNLHLIAAADHVIDLGPGPAENGGTVVAAGSPKQIAKEKKSVTGQYLREFFSARKS